MDLKRPEEPIPTADSDMVDCKGDPSDNVHAWIRGTNTLTLGLGASDDIP
jgi:hypothetical protein